MADRFHAAGSGPVDEVILRRALWNELFLVCHRTLGPLKTNASQCGAAKLLCAHASPTVVVNKDDLTALGVCGALARRAVANPGPCGSFPRARQCRISSALSRE